MPRNGQIPDPTALPPAKGDLRSDPEALARFGRLVGLLYLIGGLSSVPSSLLVEPAPSAMIIPVTAAAILGGLFWLAFPWRAADPRLMHVAVAGGTLVIGLAIVAAGPTYGFYGMLIAVFAAYSFHSRRAIAGHLAFLIVALLAPIATDPGMGRAAAQVSFLVIPNALVAAVLIGFLRERSVEREGVVRRFAAEALELSSRISSSHPNG